MRVPGKAQSGSLERAGILALGPYILYQLEGGPRMSFRGLRTS